MARRQVHAWRARAFVALALMGTSGCIDTFDGSYVEVLFASGVPVVGSTEAGAAPDGTHLELYIVKDNASFHLSSFEFVPVVDSSHPCFIETGGEIPFSHVSAAGLHVSQWLAKSREVYLEDGVVDDDEAGAIADAEAREVGIGQLEDDVKALVSTPYGALSDDDLTHADVDALFAELPPNDAMDDASNQQRLELCQEFFSLHPDYYVGSDRLMTRPLNGVFYGVADGSDPRTGGFIGGATLIVDANIRDFDAMRVNWQFNDPNDSRAEALGSSPVGYHFMAGVPETRTRGVVNVSLANSAFSMISAEVAYFSNLDEGSSWF